ncbi:MAG: DUF4296 domain-containing protein [Bacteroidetes bacterium]|nr:DUF4296 domain-containing protein [Bacteroidota bacterium]
MIKKLCIYSLCFLLLSCHHKKETEPINASKILNKTQIKDILVDFYIAEAILASNVKENYNVRQYTTHYYDFIFKKYHTNRQQILNSIQYYCFNTKEFSVIYTDVINKLTTMKTKRNEE